MTIDSVIEYLDHLHSHASKQEDEGDYAPGAESYWKGRKSGLLDAIEVLRQLQGEDS